MIVRFGLTIVDLEAGTVTTGGLGRKVNPKDFQVLKELIEHRGQVVSYEKLREAVWPDSKQDIKRSVQTAIYNINAALGSRGYIENIPNEGYRFRDDIPVDRLGGTSPDADQPPDQPEGEASPVPVPWTRSVPVLQRLVGFLSILVLTALIGYAWVAYRYWLPGDPSVFQWSGKVATALDTSGRVVWTRDFPYQILPINEMVLRPVLADIDGDGKIETVVAYHHVERESLGWDVYCLSSRGETKWRVSPTRSPRSLDGKEYKPPYVVRDFRVFPSPQHDGTQWTAAVFVHHVSYPSLVVIADAQGRIRSEFWNVGHLNELFVNDLDGDGVSEILVTGVQHGAEEAVLVILDPRNANGLAPTTPPDLPLRFQGLPEARPKAIVYFPRTEVNRKKGRFNVASLVSFVGPNLQVQVYENLARLEGYLIYTLSRKLEVLEIVQTTAYRDVAVSLIREGMLADRSWEEEAEELKSKVRVLRPGNP